MRFLILCALLLGSSACGESVPSACLDAVAPAPDGAYVSAVVAAEGGRSLDVTFARGTTLRVPRAPRRIVSMLPGLTEILGMLGGGEALVGVSPHCDRPAALVAGLERVSVMPVDYEALVALEPDLILTDATLHGNELREMQRRHLAVLPLESSRSLAHLATTVDLLAEVLGTAEAKEEARVFREDLGRALADAAPGVDERAPRVLLVADPLPLYVLGPGALLDDMIRVCGGINVACDLGRASGPFAAELVPARRPDWIFTSGRALPGLLRERWADVPAIQADQVASVGTDAFVRAGPRSPDALRRLAAVIQGRVPPNLLGED